MSCYYPPHCPNLPNFRAESAQTSLQTVNGIYSGSASHLFSILSILCFALIFLKWKSFHMPERKRQKTKGFRISHFQWWFSSDIMAVKGLSLSVASHSVRLSNLCFASHSVRLSSLSFASHSVRLSSLSFVNYSAVLLSLTVATAYYRPTLKTLFRIVLTES